MINIFPLSDMLQLLQPFLFFYFFHVCFTYKSRHFVKADRYSNYWWINWRCEQNRGDCTSTCPDTKPGYVQDASLDLHRDVPREGRGDLGCTAEHSLALLQQLKVTFCFVLQAALTIWLVLCSLSCFLPDINKWD